MGEEKLAGVAAALGASLAWLRYGVVGAEDLARVREAAFTAGWTAALDRVVAEVTGVRLLRPGQVFAELEAAAGEGSPVPEPTETPAERKARLQREELAVEEQAYQERMARKAREAEEAKAAEEAAQPPARRASGRR